MKNKKDLPKLIVPQLTIDNLPVIFLGISELIEALRTGLDSLSLDDKMKLSIEIKYVKISEDDVKKAKKFEGF